MKRKQPNISINKPITLIIIGCFIAIIGQLSFIILSPTVDGKDLKEFAKNRNTVKETLIAPRGTIYDSNKEPLGQSVNSYTIIAYLDKNRTENINKPQHVVDKRKTAELIAPIINEDPEYLYKLLNQEDKYQVELGIKSKGLTELIKEEIEALDLPGIDFVKSSKRFYKMGEFAPYTIGYAKKNDEQQMVGEMGIEYYYNSLLAGTDGYRVYQKDAYGYPLPKTEVQQLDPISGHDVFLTIDNNVQLFTENAITKMLKENTADRIMVNIMDAKTGEILSSASSPSFNPNTLEIESYINPLTSYAYEPGSTMKIFSFMAAMEEEIYDGDKKYMSGTIPIADAEIKDFNNVGWGEITFDEGFTYSSNVATSLLALELGADKLKHHYDNLGFGQKVGIQLPSESIGKVKFKYQTEIATAAFGHGITTTPLQNLQALSFLANDGMIIKPHIVKQVVDTKNNKVVESYEREEVGRVASKKTTDKMIELMRQTVTTRRTDAFAYEPNTVNVIGKTGTAQIAHNGTYLTGPYDYIKSFAGAFPYEDPQYIIYVSVERFNGSIGVVGRAVADLIAEVAKYKNVEIKEEVAPSQIKISSYISEDIKETKESLKDNNIDIITIGDGDKIIKQYPMNQSILKDSKLYLVTNSTNIKMPNTKGWTRNEITTYLNLIGIEYKINGYGRVESTNIEPGTLLKDQIVEINLQ